MIFQPKLSKCHYHLKYHDIHSPRFFLDLPKGGCYFQNQMWKEYLECGDMSRQPECGPSRGPRKSAVLTAHSEFKHLN